MCSASKSPDRHWCGASMSASSLLCAHHCTSAPRMHASPVLCSAEHSPALKFTESLTKQHRHRHCPPLQRADVAYIECSEINRRQNGTDVVPRNLTSPSIVIVCEEERACNGSNIEIANRSMDRVALRCDAAESCSFSTVTLSNVEATEMIVLCFDVSLCNAL